MKSSYGAAETQLTNAGKDKDTHNAWTRLISMSSFAVLIVVVWTCMVAQQMVIKEVLSPTMYGYHDRIWPYPIALTGVVNGLCSALCLCVLGCGKLCCDKATVGSLHWWQVGLLVIAGLFEGLERALGNMSFKYLDLSTRGMFSVTGIVFVFMVATCTGLERANLYSTLGILTIMVGGVLQLLDGSSQLKSMGVILMLISLFSGAIRWALLQKCVQFDPSQVQTPIQKIKIIAMSKPLDCVLCLVLDLCVGSGSFNSVPSEVMKFWILGGLIITCLVVAEITFVKLTSSVAMGVVAVLGAIPTLLAGMVLDNETCTTWKAVGFAVCVLGACFYFASKAGIISAVPPSNNDESNPLAKKCINQEDFTNEIEASAIDKA